MIMKVRKAPGEKAAMENLLAKEEWWLERNTQEMPLMGDGKVKKEGALLELYRKLRPGEPPTVMGGQQLLLS